MLIEKTYESVMNSQERDEQVDVLLNASNIQYENIEALLGGKKPNTKQQEL